MQNYLNLKTSKKLRRKSYRESFVKANLVNSLTHQIALIRKNRKWSQRELADKMGSRQSVISRYEDTAYGKFSIAALLDIAKAFDVGLQVRFVPFSQIVDDRNNWTPESTVVPSFDEEIEHSATGTKTERQFKLFTVAVSTAIAKHEFLNHSDANSISPEVIPVQKNVSHLYINQINIE